MIVGPHPLRGDALYVVQIFPVILGQPFVAHGPVEPFDLGILLWLARLDIFELYAPCPGPINNCRAQVFGPVIAPNGQGLSPPADDLLEGADHALGRQREVNLNAQRFAVEVVDHVEHADAAPIGKLVMHEVHRPYLVQVGWHGQWFGRLPNQPFARLDPQVQFELSIDPVRTLMVPAEASNIAQIQEAQTKAPVAVVVCQT